MQTAVLSILCVCFFLSVCLSVCLSVLNACLHRLAQSTSWRGKLFQWAGDNDLQYFFHMICFILSV